MKALRQIWLRLFPRYERLDLMVATYTQADDLIRDSAGKSEALQWRIAPEEDTNRAIGYVYLERRRRILS